MKKKFLAVLLSLAMGLSLAACGGQESAPSDGGNEPAEVTDSGETAAESGEETSGGETAGGETAEGGEEASAPAGEETPAEDGGEEETASLQGAEDMRVAMVTDYGDITDQSFNQTTYEACKAWCGANGVDFTYFKPAGDSDAERVSMIEKAVDEDYNVIVLPGYAFGNAVKETAPEYDDVTFIALDVGPGDLGDGYEPPANLYCAVYQEELSGYMAGYAAVKLGYTHLGYLGGMAVPAVQRFGYGYVQGANAAAAEIGSPVTLEYVYGNAFSGNADITAYMDTWYQQLGVEVVFACGGGIWTSAAEAAAKTDGKVIGVDVDQSGIIDGQYGAGMTVTSAMKGLTATVNHMLTEIAAGNFSAYGGQIATLGMVSDDPGENYVQLPMDTTQWGDTFTQDDYRALVAGIHSGAIAVSSDISGQPDAFGTSIEVNVYGNIK